MKEINLKCKHDNNGQIKTVCFLMKKYLKSSYPAFSAIKDYNEREEKEEIISIFIKINMNGCVDFIISYCPFCGGFLRPNTYKQ